MLLQAFRLQSAISVSNSERTFGQLLEKGRQLLPHIQNLAGYAPAEVDLEPASFDAFLNLVASANVQVECGVGFASASAG